MAAAARSLPKIRLRGRSYLAMVLGPEPPVAEWLAELDALLRRSPAAFVGRPVVLNLSALSLSKLDLRQLITDLHRRDIRIMGVEGADHSLGLGFPPLMSGGRPADIEVPTTGAPERPATVPSAQPQSSLHGPALLLDTPVRSGQSVTFLEGDVTVVGSVASGAEVIAGGSIHIYGALRGRAIAGSTGNSRARIFCRRFEPELVAIDGLYKAADDMATGLRNRPVQAWLEGDQILISALD